MIHLSPTSPFARERTDAFSAVTGGSALSFHRFSMGEAAAPRAGNAEGAELPPREVVEKSQAREPWNGREGVGPFLVMASLCQNF